MIVQNKLDSSESISHSLDDLTGLPGDLEDSISVQAKPSKNVCVRTILFVFNFFKKVVQAIFLFLVCVVLFAVLLTVIFPIIGVVVLVRLVAILILGLTGGFPEEVEKGWLNLIDLSSRKNIVEKG